MRGDTTGLHGLRTNEHGRASVAEVSSTFRLRSRDGTSKYTIFTQPNITITSSLIVSPILLLIACFLSVLVKLQGNKLIFLRKAQDQSNADSHMMGAAYKTVND